MKRPCTGLPSMRAWLLAAILLSGCTGGGDAAPAADADGSPPSDGPAPMNSTLRQVRSSIPVDWDGRTKEGAWVCSDQDGIAECPAGQQVAPDGQHVAAVPYAANLTLVDVNLTWQADPSQTGLVLAVYGNTSAGRVLLAYMRGASPLNVRVTAQDLAQVVPDNVVVFMVWPEGKTPTEPSLYVDATRQAFTLEGRMETLDSETAPA